MNPNIDLKNHYLLILCFVTSIITYWGLSQLNALFSNLFFGVVKLLDLPIMTVFITGRIIDGLVLIGLIVFIINFSKMDNFSTVQKIPDLILDRKKLRIFGILVLVLLIIAPFSNFLIQDSFLLRWQEYLSAKGNNVLYSLYFNIIPSIIEIVSDLLIIGAFFILINKLPKVNKRAETP
ncbi:hypothetical protein [Labilibacter marinus]|uniref:hypothetical protein n=1 Tax=Labilibacter marinus TaxID=1477105 RepID=UPI0008300A5A|nr:hypothetical protein [Labilibacter marinus]